MAKKAIPSIHTPIQEKDGSVAWVWYLFFQWIAENAGKIDLSDYFTKEEIEALLELKANTEDLSTVAFTGDYDDLSNKPDVPAPQVQSDWAQADTTAVDYIKNKPTLAAVATSGDYDDLINKPTIPAPQVQSDWTQTNTSAVDYIKNKPVLATVATSGSYNDLSNRPTIPTVGDGTITLTQGGTTKGTFTVNQSGNTTIDLDAGGSGYHPDLFDHKWSDYELTDMNWVNANNFSWLPKSGENGYPVAYDHLVDDIENKLFYRWGVNGTYYTAKRYPEVGDMVYSDAGVTQKGTVAHYNSNTDELDIDTPLEVIDNAIFYGVASPEQETIAGVTIEYILATDGHKIVLADQESNVTAIYNATGVAWYYILDTTNQRFKLPRSKHNKYAGSLRVVGNGKTLGLFDGTRNLGLTVENTISAGMMPTAYNINVGIPASGGVGGNLTVGITTDPEKSGIIAQQEQDTDQYKYLYFYVGNFTQEALENTAGLNASLFNNKLDLDAGNATNTTKTTVVGWAIPDFSRITTITVSQTPTLATQNMYVWGSFPGGGYFFVNTENSYDPNSNSKRMFGNLGSWSSGNCIVPKGCYYYANMASGELFWCPLKGE